MFGRMLKPLALATLLVFGCSWFSQPAQGQTVEPYGTYGYTPGAYDYSSSTPAYGWGYSPRYFYNPTLGSPVYARPAERSGTMQLQRINPPDDRTVNIRVRVPADAKIWFNGEATSQRGEVRNFQSPALTPDKRYSYDLRATWQKDGKTVERTRHLRVHAGDQVSVHLEGS
jgi:uncharacterized protein (TIGR03000 family)